MESASLLQAQAGDPDAGNQNPGMFKLGAIQLHLKGRVKLMRCVRAAASFASFGPVGDISRRAVQPLEHRTWALVLAQREESKDVMPALLSLQKTEQYFWGR